MVGSGRAHVAEVADMARANVADDIPSEALHCFASLGAGGKCASNTERDLHRWVKSLFKCNLEPYFVPMELTAAHHCWSKGTFHFVIAWCCKY